MTVLALRQDKSAPPPCLIPGSYLAHSAVEAGLHVVFTLIAGVDEAVLTLIVQLHQHTHGAPSGPPERAELQVLVSGQSQKGIAAIHQVAGHQGVWVSDGGQRVGGWAGNEADNEENLSNSAEERL